MTANRSCLGGGTGDGVGALSDDVEEPDESSPQPTAIAARPLTSGGSTSAPVAAAKSPNLLFPGRLGKDEVG